MIFVGVQHLVSLREKEGVFWRKRKNMSYIIMRNCAKFLRVGMMAVFAVGFFAVFAGETQAQTSCPDPSTHCKAECTGTETQNASCASACTGQGSALYYCVAGSSTCNASYCKSQCDSATDDTSQGAACDGFCKKTYPGGKEKYCPPKATNPPGNSGTSSPVNITLTNPLKYNTVQQVLMALLYALQGVIVVLSLVFIVIGAVLYITSTGNQARVTTAKAAIFAALIGLAIGILAPTFLKEIATVLGWNATAPLPTEVSGARSAADILLSVLNFLLGIVGILAIIFLVVGAIMFLGATGDMNRIGVAKKIIQYALLGIVVALASLVVVRQIAEFFAPVTT